MAADPFAFYRGTACLFYADMAQLEDRWCDERTSRVWIQGDLHAENFGTYMDGAGRIVFDVNDFDEAYVGHVSWDLRRFAASFALLAWRKAFSDEVIAELLAGYLHAYLDQVEHFTRLDDDKSFALIRENTEGAVHRVILETSARSRSRLLDRMTVVEDFQRRFADGPRTRRLEEAERDRVLAALDRWRGAVVPPPRRRDVAYRSEEDTSELQSRQYLVCRLLLEKKKIYLFHAFTLYFLSMILRKLTYTLYPSLFPTSFHIPHPQRSLPVAFTHPITVTAHDATPS